MIETVRRYSCDLCRQEIDPAAGRPGCGITFGNGISFCSFNGSIAEVHLCDSCADAIGERHVALLFAPPTAEEMAEAASGEDDPFGPSPARRQVIELFRLLAEVHPAGEGAPLLERIAKVIGGREEPGRGGVWVRCSPAVRDVMVEREHSFKSPRMDEAAGIIQALSRCNSTMSPDEFRQRTVKIAAAALSAIEAVDREAGQ